MEKSVHYNFMWNYGRFDARFTRYRLKQGANTTKNTQQ